MKSFIWSLFLVTLIAPTLTLANAAKTNMVPQKTISTTAERDNFIKHVESKLITYDTRVAQLKTDKDHQVKGSDRAKELDKRVNQMMDKLEDARENLADLRTSASDKWIDQQSKLNRDIAELENLSIGRAE